MMCKNVHGYFIYALFPSLVDVSSTDVISNIFGNNCDMLLESAE